MPSLNVNLLSLLPIIVFCSDFWKIIFYYACPRWSLLIIDHAFSWIAVKLRYQLIFMSLTAECFQSAPSLLTIHKPTVNSLFHTLSSWAMWSKATWNIKTDVQSHIFNRSELYAITDISHCWMIFLFLYANGNVLWNILTWTIFSKQFSVCVPCSKWRAYT